MKTAAILAFLYYSIGGLALLAAFTRLYVWFTPYNEIADIRDGKVCPAVSLVGAMIGFSAPLLSASLHGANFVDFLAWGAMACAFQLACFKFLYWICPKQVEGGNVAAALFYSGTAVCVGLFNAFSIIP